MRPLYETEMSLMGLFGTYRAAGEGEAKVDREVAAQNGRST